MHQFAKKMTFLNSSLEIALLLVYILLNLMDPATLPCCPVLVVATYVDVDDSEGNWILLGSGLSWYRYTEHSYS